MASDPQTPAPPIRQYSLTAGFLSYLVPGLGQIYQGRTGKGALFMACLLGLFCAGNAMGGWRNVYLPDESGFPDTTLLAGRFKLHGPVKAIFWRWQFLGQFWIGVAAWPALWQYNGWPVPDEQANPFLHNLQRVPMERRPDGTFDERKLNEELTDSDKTPDVAWVYTVIAGVLNILVIYDAYAGPAFLLPLRPQGDKPQGEAAT
jgi:hypothetical protein